MRDFDPTGTVAFFRERQRVETKTTGKVLRAMTPEMLDYQVHLESSTLGAIAWTIVRCLRLCSQLTHEPTAEVPRSLYPPYEELLLAFEQASHEVNQNLLKMTQDEWENRRTVTAGSRTLLDEPLGQIFWLFHADAIHHRGQISVFLRQFGARVPSIYGSSGDFQAEISNGQQGDQQ
jgi:uncharacterized damage-inducible protein DinB